MLQLPEQLGEEAHLAIRQHSRISDANLLAPPWIETVLATLYTTCQELPLLIEGVGLRLRLEVRGGLLLLLAVQNPEDVIIFRPNQGCPFGTAAGQGQRPCSTCPHKQQRG